MPGRGIGERLAVDPNKNSIVYFGARSGNGLFKSTDFGATWKAVSSFKWPGEICRKYHCAWITFDSTSGMKGAMTPRIFVVRIQVGRWWIHVNMDRHQSNPNEFCQLWVDMAEHRLWIYVVSNMAFHNPTYGTTRDLDYAGNKPANIVRSGESDTAIKVALSSDFGKSWNADYGASTSTAPGKVAYSADADTVLLMSSGGAFVSHFTNPFVSVSSLPLGAAIASDKRNNSVFYGGSAGSFYASSDIGTSFLKTTSLGSSTAVNQIRVHPLVAGDVWVTTDTGLYHSLNYGRAFSKIYTGLTAGYGFALGAASTSTGYPAIYGFFTIDGVTALFKSEDVGISWAMISDAENGFGAASANCVGADMSTYGLVYVGTNGRGIFYGSRIGSTPTSTATVGTPVTTSTKSTSTASIYLNFIKLLAGVNFDNGKDVEHQFKGYIKQFDIIRGYPGRHKYAAVEALTLDQKFVPHNGLANLQTRSIHSVYPNTVATPDFVHARYMQILTCNFSMDCLV
ncbi:putative Xyloglucanase [Glarea lozoyensis 74030]|uniref:Putative Xyloglucanase n=1 Tax=Glarea lozoyensis (strain ATCC 74030 / MF5533) TaxID=1104152 RepID=H0EFY8_GLAL7|nr:putative Xyloglucanase [Glarea lozoyensis 74030]